MKCGLVMSDGNGGDYYFHFLTPELFREIEWKEGETFDAWFCRAHRTLGEAVEAKDPRLLFTAYTQQGITEVLEGLPEVTITAIISMQPM